MVSNIRVPVSAPQLALRVGWSRFSTIEHKTEDYIKHYSAYQALPRSTALYTGRGA